jgi:hypothetical protein
MKRLSVCVLLAVPLLVTLACQGTSEKQDPVARGEYLVNLGGCNDCHTPMKLGPNGAEPDMSRMLSGHPESVKLPPPPKPEGPWMVALFPNSAWAGPWGISYTANLTPDEETGLGVWTADTFIKTMRTGKHLGVGRPILPPMPWQNFGKLSDDDLKAIFAYLQSIPPIKNKVPAPVPPAGAPPMMPAKGK